MDRPVVVLRHVPHEGLGTLAPALAAAGLPFRCLDTAQGRPAFPRARDIAGLVVLGGPMGVYEQDRFPFLSREIAYIEKVMAAGRPLLGICLGAQLIARALGARVYPNRRKEIGWHPLRRTPAPDPLFAPFPPRTTVFQWHGDTFDLPAGATLLAASPLCRHQAFRHGAATYALQFHLEVDAKMIRDWCGQPGAAEERAAAGRPAGPGMTRNLGPRTRALARLARPFFRGLTALFRGGLSPGRTKR